MISARQHCIPAYDEPCRLRQVAQIPDYLEEMEEKTAGGIILKIKTVVESDYFKNLPENAVIKSGINYAYQWSKTEAKAEAERIWNECKSFL